MAVIKAVSSKAGIGQALDYVTKEEKTEDKLVSGLHCEISIAYRFKLCQDSKSENAKYFFKTY